MIEYTNVDAPIKEVTCSGFQRCIAICERDYILESNSGGLTWEITPTNGTFIASFCDGDDFCVIVGYRGVIMTSDVIGSWIDVGALHKGGSLSLSVYNDIQHSEALIASSWRGMGESNGIIISDDAQYWKEVTGTFTPFIEFIAVSDDNVWVGANSSGVIFRTTFLESGCQWEKLLESPSFTTLTYLGPYNSEFIATGYVNGK